MGYPFHEALNKSQNSFLSFEFLSAKKKKSENMKAIMFICVATLLLLLNANQCQSKHISGVTCYYGATSPRGSSLPIDKLKGKTCDKEGCVTYRSRDGRFPELWEFGCVTDVKLPNGEDLDDWNNLKHNACTIIYGTKYCVCDYRNYCNNKFVYTHMKSHLK